jgi:NAD+ synthase
MKNNLLINPEQETQKITTFLNNTFVEQQITNAVLGLSGGIDSTTSFYLLQRVLKPEHIFVMHLYYDNPSLANIHKMLKDAKIPETNYQIFSIHDAVAAIGQTINLTNEKDTQKAKIRRGNIAARVRMIMLFDYAKANNALVCGTENKSENLLGYFTRFGDQASDIEPLEHLYKTQIYQLAEFLNIPEVIRKQQPTAGLWHGQTDEGQFGFTYEEADQVLSMFVDEKKNLEEIKQAGFLNAEKILQWRSQNLFKHNTPYAL